MTTPTPTSAQAKQPLVTSSMIPSIASLTMAIVGLLSWYLQIYVFHGSVPGPVASGIYTVVPAMITYAASHICLNKTPPSQAAVNADIKARFQEALKKPATWAEPQGTGGGGGSGFSGMATRSTQFPVQPPPNTPYPAQSGPPTTPDIQHVETVAPQEKPVIPVGDPLNPQEPQTLEGYIAVHGGIPTPPTEPAGPANLGWGTTSSTPPGGGATS